MCQHMKPFSASLKGLQAAWQAATSIWPKHKLGISNNSFPSFILLVLDIVTLELRAW